LDCLTTEDGTDKLYRNVGKQLRCINPQKSEDLKYTAAKASNLEPRGSVGLLSQACKSDGD
jgi:hypothetical protein